MIDVHLLDKIGERCRTDKCSAFSPHAAHGHGYCDIYQRYFDPELKTSAEQVLEIGVGKGNSLRMWAEYFDKAQIYGLDNRVLGTEPNPRICIFASDQANRRDLKRTTDAVNGSFDVIIDDGGHTMFQQQTSLGYLFKHLGPGGLYVVEDLITSQATRGKFNPTGTTWTTLRILQELRDGGAIAKARGFATIDELVYLIDNTASVNIERGLKSEIAFIRKVAA